MEYYLIHGVSEHLFCPEFEKVLALIDETFLGLALPFVAIDRGARRLGSAIVEFPNGREVALDYLYYEKINQKK
jgi:hypothetical protein